MPATLPGNVKELIDRANFAHLATLMEDGSPHSTPVWVGRDGDRLMIGTSGNSLKARREDLRLLLEDRFGPLPELVAQRIEAMNDLQRLSGLFRQALRVTSLTELEW